jgi:hypothetical protein
MCSRRFGCLYVLSISLIVSLCTAGLAQTTAPVPQIANPLVPTAVVPGSPAFSLTVNGTGFASGSTVYWNGSPRITTYISAAQLAATINAADVATATSGLVTVHNSGGTVSNVAFLLVTAPVAAPSFGSSAIPQTLGSYSWTLLAGDLTGDGFADTIVSPGTYVESVLGIGNGSFQYPVDCSFPSTTQVYSGLLADINNDGNLDFITSGCNNTCSFNAVNVLLGNGDGTFQADTQSFIGDNYDVAVAADFNGDGKLDLAYGAYSAFGIMLGNGDGTFTLLPEISLVDGPASIAVGDFNRDGVPDIAVSRYLSGGGAGYISIFMGNGDGTFGSGTDYAVGRAPYGMAVGDLNGDGYPDITVVDVGSYNTFYVLLNNGDGTFGSPVAYGGPDSGSSLTIAALGDFNADGKLDIAIYEEGSCNDGCLDLFEGNGDGTLQQPLVYLHRQDRGSFAGGQFAVTDFNRDGLLDIVSPGGTGPFVMLQSSAPEPTLDPGSLVFGSQAAGSQSSTQYVTLLQPGNTAITINSIIGSSNFQSDGGCVGHVLNPGNTYCDTGVYFSPTTTGSLTGSLTITSSGGTQYVSLIGTATAAINVSVAPSTINFGTAVLNSTSYTQRVQITNIGSQILDLSGIALTGANPGDFLMTNPCGPTLSVGASCTVSTNFRPTAQGVRTASVSVSDNAANSPQTVALSGTGTALSLSASLLNFGNVAVGASSTQTLLLHNVGPRPFAIGQIKIIGNDGKNYSQSNNCGTSIAARSDCMMRVTFAPEVQGLLDSALTFSSTGTGTSAVTSITLKGRGE